MNKNLIWLLLLTLLVSVTGYGAVTITTPTVNTGELIRAGDWNKIRADLDSLNSALDIYGNQSWQSSGGNMYYLNGKVGIGVATPPAQLGVYKESPAANETMFQIGTGADDEKFTIDEDGDITADGTMLLRGGTLYDSSGGLELHGEDDVYVGIDWNNNDADNRSFVIGKNAAGPGTNWEEIMVVQEDGKVGIGTSSPGHKLHIAASTGNADIMIDSPAGMNSQIRFAETGAQKFKVEYRPAPDDFKLGAVMLLEVDTGNVGIGTTSPASELDVSGTIRAEEICDETGTNCQDISAGWSGGGSSAWTGNGGNVSRSTGNVGIGTTAPAGKLTISDGGASGLEITPNYVAGNETFLSNYNRSTSQYEDFRLVTQDFHVRTGQNNHDAIYANSSGNVGIGTVSPAHKLDVAGNMRTTGQNIYFGTGEQKIYGDNGGAFYMDFNHDTYGSLRLRDKQDETLTTLVAHKGINAGDNGHFGLMDADNNWAFLNHTDNYSETRINDIGRMHINTDNTFLRGQQLQVGWNRTGNRYAYMDLVGDDTYTDFGLRVIRGDQGPNTWSEINHRGTGTFYVGTYDAADFRLRTNWADRVTVKANTGNVGIGTASPGRKLHVVGDGIRISNSTWNWFEMYGGYKTFRMHYGDSSNELRFGRYGSNFGSWEANPIKFDLDAPTSSLVLSDTGNVGIGTPNATHKLTIAYSNGASQGWDSFDSGGEKYVRSSIGGQVTRINQSTGFCDLRNNIACASDIRLKTVKSKVTEALTKISHLNAIIYKWNSDSGLDPTNQHIGLSAQEIACIDGKVKTSTEGLYQVGPDGLLLCDTEQLFPEAVNVSMKDEKQVLTASYDVLVAPLIESVKELKAEKDAEIEALKARLEALEAAQ